MKPIDFHPKALEFIRTQTTAIRRQAGEALRGLQKGMALGMPLSKPMPTIAPGVSELRIKDATVTVRVFYAIGKEDAIVVFHAFLKKSQKTLMREVNLGQRRLQEVLDAKIES